MTSSAVHRSNAFLKYTAQSTTHLTPNTALIKLVTFVLWLALGLSAVGWGLKLWGQMSGAEPSYTQVTTATPLSQSVATQRVSALLGAQPQAVQNTLSNALARLSLTGLIRTGEGAGIALISVDAQTPKPYRSGAAVGDTFVLSSIEARSVTLKAVQGAEQTNQVAGLQASDSSTFSLELPKRAQAKPNGEILSKSADPKSSANSSAPLSPHAPGAGPQTMVSK